MIAQKIAVAAITPREEVRAAEMVKALTCCPARMRTWVWPPSTQKKVRQTAGVCKPSGCRGEDRRITGAHWPTQLSQINSSNSSESLSQEIRWKQSRKTPDVTCNISMYTHTHNTHECIQYTQTCTHTGTYTLSWSYTHTYNTKNM